MEKSIRFEQTFVCFLSNPIDNFIQSTVLCNKMNKPKQFQTPILFLIFNRPNTTALVFQRIRAIKPKYLFVAADGPRLSKLGEAELCEQARKMVLDNIDWDCELKTRFLEKNLGCKMAVSSAITWFYKNVEEGIILEDDCLPDLSFFYFCEELLNYYRNNERIMHIGGANFQDGRQRGDGSYYFSQINHIWGWATWRRAWRLYDVEMKSYPDFLNQEKLMQSFPNSSICKFWKKNYDLVYRKEKDTWDIQWQYAIISSGGFAITPNTNLVKNIGFGDNATHTTIKLHPFANKKTSSVEKMEHPQFIEYDALADIYTYRHYLNPPKYKKLWFLLHSYFKG